MHTFPLGYTLELFKNSIFCGLYKINTEIEN